MLYIKCMRKRENPRFDYKDYREHIMVILVNHTVVVNVLNKVMIMKSLVMIYNTHEPFQVPS